MKKKIFCFDLDNTLCFTKKNYYKNSKPKKKIIKLINKLYQEGHTIKIFTSRFMGRSNENCKIANKKGFLLTKNQLKKWRVCHHSLIMGKPSYDILIDDKSWNFNKNWHKEVGSIYLKNIEKNVKKN
jgi:hydroxymethylpyrimidine pyrophosphatase-like HAD family hydrolase